MNQTMVHIILFFLLVFFCFAEKSAAGEPFQFENINSVEDMSQFIKKNFSLKSTRDDFRKSFVDEGHATLKIHPVNPNTEKYIYDINLCSYYIWRWNISADYDGSGALQQAYLNGARVFPESTPEKKIPEGEKLAIYKGQRPRPEANKGESSLSFVLFDGDSNPETITDQILMGGGPSRPDPSNMGTMLMYRTDPWRSIFDRDKADVIHPYKEDCAKANKAMEAAKNGKNR